MLSLNNISITQGDFSLKDINLEIEKGDYVVLMGKTGCGKTTILESICGLRKINSGTIMLNDQDITKMKPAERCIGYVPQDGALFSSMDVRGNLSFSLRIRRWDKKRISVRVSELADLLGIHHLLDRNITGLSGGERQRIALGRGLASYPEFLCMDEPLSALDEPTRDEMYALLKTLKTELKITALHISHSMNDAEVLADKILKMENNQIIE